VKVFWSWQSDTPGKIGRHFIREAIAAAIAELKVEAEIDEPDARDLRSALHLDQDRQGVPGSPDLARVILDKISKAAVFIADVTSVGIATNDRENSSGKKLINANVAIELGYALGTIGDGALLMVMNEEFGTRDDLPFDLKAKAGPLLFRLMPDATKDDISRASRNLVAQLKQAINLCVANHAEETRKATPFPAAEEKDGPARFRMRGAAIGNRWGNLPFGELETPVRLADGPALWLRLRPASATGRTFPAYELRERVLYSGNFSLRLITEGPSMFGIRDDDGYGLCTLFPPESEETTSVVFAFETGEIWSIDTDQLRFGSIPFIEPIYKSRLQDYARFLGSLGLDPPYRWNCGMTGVKGYRFQMPVRDGYMQHGPGPLCLADTIRSEGDFNGFEPPQTALYPFFKEIFDRCGVRRPDYMPR